MRRVLRLIAILAVLYVLACLGARWVSTKLLFPAPPPTYGEALPGLVMIPGADGRRFAAVHRPNPQAKHLILYFHGNGEDLGSAFGQIEERAAHGFAVLAVDYSGYGLTGGAPSESGVYAAAAAAYGYAIGPLGWPKERVIVNGFSLGGAAAVWLAAREPVGGLVLQSTFVSAYRVKLDAPLVVGDRMPNLRRIAQMRRPVPVLVVHGLDDGMIPWTHGRRLYEAAAGPKRCLWVPGAGHNNVISVAGDRYWRELDAFAASLP